MGGVNWSLKQGVPVAPWKNCDIVTAKKNLKKKKKPKQYTLKDKILEI